LDDTRDNLRGPTDGGRDGDGKYDVRREAHVAEISARLRHVCQHLTDDEFTQLVLHMVETRLRFATIESDSFARVRPPPEQSDGRDGRPPER
jgi:hypothetical protein